jgi:hypothetical protein
MKDMKGILNTNSLCYTDGSCTVCIQFIRFVLEEVNNEVWIMSLRFQQVLHFIKSKHEDNSQW